MILPTLIPVKPRVRRKRRQVLSASSGPPVTVEVVGTDDPPEPGKCHWVLLPSVTLTGLPIGLRVLVDGVWLNPISATQPSDDEIWCVYDTAEMLDGKDYSIIAPPSGIAEAAQIVLPQEGTIIAP